MASKKNNLTLLLLLLFVLTGAGAWWLNKEEDKTGDKTARILEGMQFATATANVHKIFIAQRDGSKVSLTRNGDHWMVNDKYRANANIMKNMMTTLGRVSVKYIPTRASNEHIIKEMASIGIKVELYGKSDNLIKTYYVGGSTNDELGTYMIMEGSDQPYVTHLPSLEGGLRWRFTPKEENWRDKTIVRAKPDEIKSVSVNYPTRKSEAFSLAINGKDDFAVSPVNELVTIEGGKVNSNAVHSYLVGFESVIAEGFENINQGIDSIRQTTPFSILEIKKNSGEKKVIKFFPIDKELKNPTSGQAQPVHRYYADVNGEDLYLVQQRVVGKLFWGYKSFFN